MSTAARFLTALVALSLQFTNAAARETTGGSHQGEDDASISVGVRSGDEGAWTNPGGGVRCTYDEAPGGPDEVTRYIDGVWYIAYLRDCEGRVGVVWVPQLSAQELADAARDDVRRLLPNPRVQLAPPASQGVVQVGTWIWADPAVWRPVSATASIPGLAATVTATPRRLRFDPGDGSYGSGPITCEGPGQVWQPAYGDDATSTCMYTWRHSSSLSPSGQWTTRATIEWSVSYQSSNGQTGALGPLITTGTQPVTIGEIQALLTDP